jgi:hypothetical protein
MTLGLIKSEKNTYDLLGKRKVQERSAPKVNRQMEPLNQQRTLNNLQSIRGHVI